MPDVPHHLLRLWNPAREAPDPSAIAPSWASAVAPGTDWGRAVRDAQLTALEHPDARHLREYGLPAARKPRLLGEHDLGDELGREVLGALAARMRRGG